MILLGLDIGAKRTGVAISAGIYAREFRTLSQPERLADDVAAICQQERVERIVIGLPYKEDGELSEQAKYIQTVAQAIAQATKLPIIFEDEQLSSISARQLLTQSGLNPKLIDQQIDQTAARLILQQYIDEHQHEWQ